MAFYKGSGLSITSLVTLQQTTARINAIVSIVVGRIKIVTSKLKVIDDLYTMCNIENSIKDGDKPYPPVIAAKEERETVSTQKGAKLEFKLV